MVYLKDELAEAETDLHKLDSNSMALIASSIRLLMCWLSHESLLEKEIFELMPKFILFSANLSTASLNFSQISLYEFMSAGLQKIYLNLKAKYDLCEMKKSKSVDLNSGVQCEFEKLELNEEMKSVKEMLDKCYANMKDPKSPKTSWIF